MFAGSIRRLVRIAPVITAIIPTYFKTLSNMLFFRMRNGARGQIRTDTVKILSLPSLPLEYAGLNSWWAHMDLNQEPTVYETVALTN